MAGTKDYMFSQINEGKPTSRTYRTIGVYYSYKVLKPEIFISQTPRIGNQKSSKEDEE